jgi:lipopolysaccharide/colanic/teichoic acid biosynthesis glycosyltransferase
MTKNGHKEFFASAPTETEHIVMIGTTKLTSLYMQLIETYSPDTRQVIAILDDNPQLIGRSIAGIRVVGPPSHLESIINEFSDHGIHTDRVVVGGDPNMLSVEQIDQIDHICDNHEIHLDFVPSLVGLTDSQTEPAEAPENPPQPPPTGTISQYLRTKRFFDFTLGVALSFLLLPVFFVVAALVLLDVGSPIFFWQRRVGVGGHSFLLHKFRTLKTSFDWRGLPVPNPERLSQIGSLLRRFRLDELPQLLNVIVGDMAIVGPRPLLPRDQPPDPSLRLLARPGITGWAQVNGGKLLSSAEKAELDEWYIRHASFWLDLRILAKTVHVLIWGERRHDAERVHKTAIKQELNVSSPSKSSST